MNLHYSAGYLVRANTVARQHGKRELKGKGGAAFLYKSQISNLVWKIRSKTCFDQRYANFWLNMSKIEFYQNQSGSMHIRGARAI